MVKSVITCDDLIADGACFDGVYEAATRIRAPAAMPVSKVLRLIPSESRRVSHATGLDGFGDGCGDSYGSASFFEIGDGVGGGFGVGDGNGSGDGVGGRRFYGQDYRGDGFGYGDGDSYGDTHQFSDGDGLGGGCHDGNEYGHGYGYGAFDGGYIQDNEC